MSDSSDAGDYSSSPNSVNRAPGVSFVEASGPGTVEIENCHIGGFDTVFDISGGTTLEVDGFTANDIRQVGARLSNADMNARDMTLRGGYYGLDLLRGSGGDLFDSVITGQIEDSIRYDRDVLYGLHNVEATSLRDRVRGRRITEDQELQLNRVLDTTPGQLKLERHGRSAQRAGRFILTASGLYGLGQQLFF